MNPEEMIAKLSPVLSPRRRYSGIAATVLGLAGGGLLVALWAGETGLPERTRLAFALLILVCACWTAYGAWVLTRRTSLFALDRVVAGWIALAASTVTTVVTAVVAVSPWPLVADAVFVGGSAVLTVVAHRRRAALLRRKRELEGG
ncbi:hypothetical protein OIE66_41465 [Nonomuraea sp. NBC_01738]|uniref:hypothetical protein n=1 Tax=Nonomuraea sp. NBC_01738 TaxID=2976003 RepID=UPI002E11CB73|nr:hypothetical protein OIE66_41465 [Nonomuraea sp. NBC_01738]